MKWTTFCGVTVSLAGVNTAANAASTDHERESHPLAPIIPRGDLIDKHPFGLARSDVVPCVQDILRSRMRTRIDHPPHICVP